MPVKPAQATKPEILEIDRANYEFNLIGEALFMVHLKYNILDAMPGVYGAETRKICALLGIVQLLSGKTGFLCVVCALETCMHNHCISLIFLRAIFASSSGEERCGYD